MKLEKYLKEIGMTQVFFAQKIGVPPPTLSTWIKKGIIPSLPMLVKIEKETKGQVKIKDWLS